MGPRFLRGVRATAVVALGVAFTASAAPSAEAQARKKATTDPCDPSYVPKKGEVLPSCPGVKLLSLEPFQSATASVAATPPPVETNRTGARTSGQAVVNAPAFQMLRDGSSKVYVQVHGVPKVTQITTRSGVTFVLSDSRVPINNNRHALLTNHFNTPVADARLAQFHNDVHLRVDLRANVEPVARLVELVRGQTVMLEVTFPPGNYYTEPIRDPERGHRSKSTGDGQRRRSGARGSSQSDGGFGPPVP